MLVIASQMGQFFRHPHSPKERASCTISFRDVNFWEFYFSIREFQISRLVEYSKLTRHSAWTTHLMRECCNTVDHAVQLWLGGGPLEVERRTGSCGSVKLQSAPVSLMYSCLVRPDRQTAVIPNSSHPVAVIAQQWTPRVAHSRWKVGERVQFSKS